jgi:nitroreductase
MLLDLSTVSVHDMTNHKKGIYMKSTLDEHALSQLFTTARTFSKFVDREVEDGTIRQLFELAKWGPTSMNSQPARFVFLKTIDAKRRLIPALAPSNADKTLAAPLCVIVAQDRHFQTYITEQFPAYDAKPMFDSNPTLAEATAFRGSSLQGAYLILAARSLGLDCGPMSGFDNDAVNQEFFPDGRLQANFLINMGYGDAEGNFPRGPRLSFSTACELL